MTTPERREVTTEIIQRWLGMRPFVVIELDGEPGDNYDTDEDDVTITMAMTFGGGVTRNGAMGIMATMLEQNGWQTTAPDGFDPDAEDD